MSRTTKALTFILAGILTLLIAVPWLVPIAAFGSRPSKPGLALRSGQPVRVADLRLSLLPLQITALAGQLSPHPGGADHGARELAGSSFGRPAFWMSSSWTGCASDPSSSAESRPGPRLRLLQAREYAASSSRTWRSASKRTTLRSLQGVVTLASNGKVQEIRVQHQGERLRIVAKPVAGGFELAIAARKWTVPVWSARCVRSNRRESPG